MLLNGVIRVLHNCTWLLFNTVVNVQVKIEGFGVRLWQYESRKMLNYPFKTCVDIHDI